MKRRILFALAVAILPGAAHAQDATIGGAFVGGQIGWGQRSAELDLGLPGIAIPGQTDFDESRSGVDFGVFAGYDFAAGSNFLVGLEAGVGAGGKTLRGTPVTGLDVAVDPKWNYDVSARAGILASPNLLLYGRVGYGAERTKVSVSSTIPGVTSESESGYSDGLLYGGGIEYGINEAASIRTEYRHRDMDGGFAADQVLAGVAFRF